MGLIEGMLQNKRLPAPARSWWHGTSHAQLAGLSSGKTFLEVNFGKMCEESQKGSYCLTQEFHSQEAHPKKMI